MPQRVLMPLMLLLTAMLMVMPGTLLYQVGWDYGSPTASPIMRLHPSTYYGLGLMGLMVLLHWNERDLATGRIRFVPLPVLAYVVCIATIFMFLLMFHGGGSIAFMIDTLLMPAIVLILLQHLSPHSKGIIFRCIAVLLSVNVLVALMEVMTGKRLIPFVILGYEVIYDKRPTALIGHPLANAAATAVAIFVFIGCLHNRSWKIMLGCLWAVGLIAFGGRSAMVLFALFYAGYFLWMMWQRSFASRLRWSDLTLISGGLLLVPIMIIYVFAFTPFGDIMLERLHWDDSAQTRLDLFHIFRFMDLGDWIVGVPNERFQTFLILLNMPWTVENAWVQLLVRFGAVFFVVFLYALYRLFRYLATGAPLEVKLALLLFLAIASTNNSLAGKGTGLSMIMVMVACGKAHASLNPAEANRRRVTSPPALQTSYA